MEWADVSVESKARLKGLVIGNLFEKHRALHAVVLVNLLKIARKVMQSSRKSLKLIKLTGNLNSCEELANEAFK